METGGGLIIVRFAGPDDGPRLPSVAAPPDARSEAPDAPCNGCRHFRGFSSIRIPDAGFRSARCQALGPVPVEVLRGGACDRFEAGEHHEFT